MSLDFPAFALSEEHEALRESVRALADDKIAPRAAEVDRTSEFPWDVYEALVKADLQAVHIPEAYGGAGADAIATVIVIEEVARACVSSSLIPAVNKLGTVPLLLAASEEVKAAYLAPVARGEAMFSYALSEPEAGSDAAAMKTRAVRSADGYVLNGVKRWITNAGVSKYYTVMAVTDPSAEANGISAFVLEDGDPGLRSGRPSTSSASRARRPGSCTSTTARSRPRGSSAPKGKASGLRCAPWTTPASRSPRRRSASPRAPWTTRSATSGNAGSSAARSPSSRACSS